MKNLRTGITAAAATAVLSLGGVALAATATASNPHTSSSTAPCATQQTQFDRAEAKLVSLNAKFLAATAKVKQDKAALHGSATGQAKKALARDKAKRAGLLKAKKAQVQRVKHAQARLDACNAAHPSSTATSTSTSTSTSTATSTATS